ncbi:MAG TPA: diacylglycerol kinase family protein, partial [bacterium]|nr:diacylglycerol kinase family protein [bacterium]
MNWQDKSVLLIWNRKAGSSRVLSVQSKWIETLTQLCGRLDVRIPNNPEQIESILQDVMPCARPDVVIAGGGDGTLHLVVRGLLKADSMRRASVAQLPFGSGNDFLRQYGFHRLNSRNLFRFVQCSLESLDVGWCAEVPFVNGVGFGLAADTGRRFAEMANRSALNYLFASIHSIV